MNKNFKYLYYAFFVLAFLFVVKAIGNFNTDRESAYMQFAFAFILIVYGLFRLRYMKKFNEYHKQNKNKDT